MLRFVLLCFLLCPTFLNAQQDTVLIQAHLKAIGGEAAWKKISSLQMDGRLENDFEVIKIREYWIKGKSYRRDMQFGGRTVADTGTRYFILIHQNKGWKKLPDQIKPDPAALDKSEMVYYLQHIELDDPFVDYQESGKKISYQGTEFFNEKDYHKFLIATTEGTQEYCYLDPKDLMIHMRVTVGSDNDQTRVFESWSRNKEGMMIPGEIRSPQGVLTIESARLNPVLKPELFNLKALTE